MSELNESIAISTDSYLGERWEIDVRQVEALRLACQLHAVLWEYWRSDYYNYKLFGEPELTEEGAIVIRNA